MTHSQRIRAIRQLARQRNAVEREIRARCELVLTALRWLFPAPHTLAHDSAWCVRALRRRLVAQRGSLEAEIQATGELALVALRWLMPGTAVSPVDADWLRNAVRRRLWELGAPGRLLRRVSVSSVPSV